MGAVLVLNAGSSSLKFEVFEVLGADVRSTAAGQIEGIGSAPRFVAREAGGVTLVDERWDDVESGGTHGVALRRLGDWLRTYLHGEKLLGVGHRVVHGGPEYSTPVRLTPEVAARLESFVALAPLHQPHNLAGIRAVSTIMPDLPQVACFDTAFHRSAPRVAQQFALPGSFYDEGVRRYGFHGLSYEYIAARLPEVAPHIAHGRVVVAHLGNGASMCALSNGHSVETTMGFTALDGLPMGTRPGQIDPGVILYLIMQEGMTASQVQDMLYRDSGLKALSGISNDIRDLLASDDPKARFAIDYFCYRIALNAGMLASALGGIDSVIFTAGIGENAAAIRANVSERLGWIGAELDANANDSGLFKISTSGSRIGLYIVPTDEEQMIARHCLTLLNEATESGTGWTSVDKAVASE